MPKRVPPIGVPRLYPGENVPLLYPGEQATAQVDIESVIHALEAGEDGTVVAVENWLVEPTPGWHGWYLRLRYRIFGRWFWSGAPKVSVDAKVEG